MTTVAEDIRRTDSLLPERNKCQLPAINVTVHPTSGQSSMNCRRYAWLSLAMALLDMPLPSVCVQSCYECYRIAVFFIDIIIIKNDNKL